MHSVRACAVQEDVNGSLLINRRSFVMLAPLLGMGPSGTRSESQSQWRRRAGGTTVGSWTANKQVTDRPT